MFFGLQAVMKHSSRGMMSRIMYTLIFSPIVRTCSATNRMSGIRGKKKKRLHTDRLYKKGQRMKAKRVENRTSGHRLVCRADLQLVEICTPIVATWTSGCETRVSIQRHEIAQSTYRL